MQTLAKKIGKASGITVTSTVVYLGLAVLTNSLIARIYGPEGLGLFAAFLMFVQLYSMFAIFGLPVALSKYTAEHEERREHLEITKIFSSLLIFATFSSISIGIISKFSTPHLARIMHIQSTDHFSFLISVALLFFSYSKLCQALFQGLLKAFKSALIQNLSFLGMLLVILYAYFFRKIPTYYAIVFGYLASGILGIWLCKKEGVLKWQFNRVALLKIIKFAIPIAIGSYLFFISQWVDRFTIGAFLGVKEIGLYTAGLTIIQAIKRIPLSLTNVLIPSYSKISVYGIEKTEKAFNFNIKILAIFLFFLAILIFLFSDYIVNALYGSNFLKTIQIVKILSLGLFFSALTIPLSTFIVGRGFPKINMYLSLVGVGVQVILVLIFTKLIGINGTAMANVFAHPVTLCGGCYIVIRVFKIKLKWLNVFKPLLNCMISASLFISARKLHLNIVASVVLLVTCYCIITWVLVLSKKEKEIIINNIRNSNDRQNL